MTLFEIDQIFFTFEVKQLLANPASVMVLHVLPEQSTLMCLLKLTSLQFTASSEPSAYSASRVESEAVPPKACFRFTVNLDFCTFKPKERKSIIGFHSLNMVVLRYKTFH